MSIFVFDFAVYVTGSLGVTHDLFRLNFAIFSKHLECARRNLETSICEFQFHIYRPVIPGLKNLKAHDFEVS